MIIAKSSNTKMLVPTGLKQAVCYDIWDIGLQKGEYKGKINQAHKIIIAWELDETIENGEYIGKRFVISKFYTLSLGKKANLRHDLESWRGKTFTEEELNGFDVENLIGCNCMLNVGLNESETNNKIMGISPIVKNMLKIVPENKRSIPSWVQKFIDKSVKEDDKNNAIESVEVAESVVDETGVPF